MIANLAGGTPTRYNGFLTVVRCVRKWAKARGLYSNKMGYLGGVNFNIMATMVCQLYPNASPSNLVRKFFLLYSKWRWPNPVVLTKVSDQKCVCAAYSRLSRVASPLLTPPLAPRPLLLRPS